MASKVSKGGGHQDTITASAKRTPRRPLQPSPTPDKKAPVSANATGCSSGPLTMGHEPRDGLKVDPRKPAKTAGELNRPRRASLGDPQVRASIRSDTTQNTSDVTGKHVKTKQQPRTLNHLPFFGSPLLPIDIVPNPSSIALKLNLMHHKDAPTVLEKIQAMKRNELGVDMVVSEPHVSLSKTKKTKKGTLDMHNSTNFTADTGFDDSIPSLSYDPTVLSSSSSHGPKVPIKELKVVKLLKTAGNASAATITMTGFKGGDLEKQINHDRSLIVSPFYLRNSQPTKTTVLRRLMAVFDGHGDGGMVFAEHCQQSLPKLLARYLEDGFTAATAALAAGATKVDDEITITKKALINAFVTLDETSPSALGGGCTATVVYEQGRKVYVANTGDSHSFIVVYRKHRHQRLKQQQQQQFQDSRTSPDVSSCIKVVYRNQEDKPDAPEERRRLESLGGFIMPAEKHKSARVKVITSMPGAPMTTAISIGMSRSIGDHKFRSVGVIPDPTVDAIDLPNLVQKELRDGSSASEKDILDDVCIFAVSASDGMMILEDQDVLRISSKLALSLFEDDGPHPLTACYNLVNDAASVWNRRNKGKFRDDISLAATILRSPPAPATATLKSHGATNSKQKPKPTK